MPVQHEMTHEAELSCQHHGLMVTRAFGLPSSLSWYGTAYCATEHLPGQPTLLCNMQPVNIRAHDNLLLG